MAKKPTTTTKHSSETKAKVPAVAEEKSTALIPSGDDFAAYEGAGMENVKAGDLLIPRLTILQGLSPQIKKNKAEYVKGAEIGDICDIGVGQVFKDGVIFLPVYYRKDYLEWAPRESGKGLVMIHPSATILEKCSRDEKGAFILSNGNYVAETAQVFGFNLSADDRPCFIGFTSTQLKKGRKWMTLATGEKLERKDGTKFIAPLFYRTYKLTTAEESNNKGDWIGWVIERDCSLPELPGNWRKLKEKAVDFCKVLSTGAARADMSQMEQPPASDDDAPPNDDARM